MGSKIDVKWCFVTEVACFVYKMRSCIVFFVKKCLKIFGDIKKSIILQPIKEFEPSRYAE